MDTLLAERDALHAWLHRIDNGVPSAPLHVVERVRADYQRRLDGVTGELRAHADTLSARLAADRSERDGLLARAAASRDALAEAELRHLVGEYDGVRYETERRRHVGDLETFELSLGAVNERIDRLEDVHALVTSAPAPVPEQTAADTDILSIETLAPDPPPEVEMALPDAGPADEKEAVASSEAGGEDDDAIDQLFEDAAMADSRPSAVRPFEPEVIGAPTFAPLSFTPTAAPVDRNPPAGPAIGQRPPTVPPRRVPEIEPPAPAPKIQPVESAAPVPPEEPAPPPAGIVEVTEPVAPRHEERTLRCGECGAMNLALEWYCEKCGAELTTA